MEYGNRKQKRNVEMENGNRKLYLTGPQHTCTLPSLCIASFLGWLSSKQAAVNLARLFTDFTGIGG